MDFNDLVDYCANVNEDLMRPNISRAGATTPTPSHSPRNTSTTVGIANPDQERQRDQKKEAAKL